MALACVSTFAVVGVDPRRVVVEVDVRRGLPAFTIVGLADRSVREARERVRAAIQNSGFEFPQQRVTVNLAPAYLHKVGPGFDLAIACAILAAAGQLPAQRLARLAVFGELALGGELRPSRGTLAVAEGVLAWGLDGLILARELGAEAALVDGVAVHAVATLAEVVAVLRGEHDGADAVAPPPAAAQSPAALDTSVDLGEVRGQPAAVEGLTIAAAGGHNLLLSGPPGTGKTMLAQRLPTILPPLTRAEAIEVTRIRNIAGVATGALATTRPFQAPHHGISQAGLVGGGSQPMPGQVTLAHHGVLFLDELSEFPRMSLEALRQPLEDGRVAIIRAQRTAIYPARFMLVAATNPCPCGYAGSTRCRCSESDHARHRKRLSGPLLDRIDIRMTVERPTSAQLSAAEAPTSSEAARARVVAARDRQRARLEGTPVTCNAQMDSALVRTHVRLDRGSEDVLWRAYDRGTLSARGQQRVLRLARTVADLRGADLVERGDVLTALDLRQDDLVQERSA